MNPHPPLPGLILRQQPERSTSRAARLREKAGCTPIWPALSARFMSRAGAAMCCLVSVFTATGNESGRNIFFHQPEITDAETAESHVIGEVRRPVSDTFFVRMGNYGRTTPIETQSWDANAFTGLKVPAGFQFGTLLAEGSTAVQLHGRETGIWIDSSHPRPGLGSLLPITPACWWWNLEKAPWPFSGDGAELSMSFEMKVPTVTREGAAQPYITINFFFVDTRSKKQFWLAAALLDLRPESEFPDTVHFDGWEGGTHIPILFSALNGRSAWMHPGKGSALFSSQPFAEYRRFDVRVTAGELKNAIKAMHARFPETEVMSDNPADYRLTHFNLNPEVYAPEGSRGTLGLALRDIRVELLGK